MSLSHPNLFENYQTLSCYNIELQAVGIIYLYQGNILKLLFLGRCLILRGSDSPFSMSGCESKSCLGRSSNLSLSWPIFHFLGWTCKFFILTSRTEGLYLSRTWLQLVLCLYLPIVNYFHFLCESCSWLAGIVLARFIRSLGFAFFFPLLVKWKTKIIASCLEFKPKSLNGHCFG